MESEKSSFDAESINAWWTEDGICVKMPEWEDYTYQVVIEPQNDTSPMPKATLLEILNHHTDAFEIEISEPGTFSYQIYEKTGDYLDVQYDSRIYHITVFVTQDDNDHLQYSVTVSETETDSKADSVQFQDGWVRDTEEVEGSQPDESSPDSPESDQTTSLPEPSTVSVPRNSDKVLTGDTSSVSSLFAITACSLVTAGLIVILSHKRARDENDQNL